MRKIAYLVVLSVLVVVALVAAPLVSAAAFPAGPPVTRIPSLGMQPSPQLLSCLGPQDGDGGGG